MDHDAGGAAAKMVEYAARRALSSRRGRIGLVRSAGVVKVFPLVTPSVAAAAGTASSAASGRGWPQLESTASSSVAIREETVAEQRRQLWTTRKWGGESVDMRGICKLRGSTMMLILDASSAAVHM
jgi:hypothetical protein